MTKKEAPKKVSYEELNLTNCPDKILSLNITKSFDESDGKDAASLLSRTQCAWRAAIPTTRKATNVVLGYRTIDYGNEKRRLVAGVYRICDFEGTKESNATNKRFLALHIHDEPVVKKYLGKLIPRLNRYDTNTVRYLGNWPDVESGNYSAIRIGSRTKTNKRHENL